MTIPKANRQQSNCSETIIISMTKAGSLIYSIASLLLNTGQWMWKCTGWPVHARNISMRLQRNLHYNTFMVGWQCVCWNSTSHKRTPCKLDSLLSWTQTFLANLHMLLWGHLKWKCINRTLIAQSWIQIRWSIHNLLISTIKNLTLNINWGLFRTERSNKNNILRHSTSLELSHSIWQWWENIRPRHCEKYVQWQLEIFCHMYMSCWKTASRVHQKTKVRTQVKRSTIFV